MTIDEVAARASNTDAATPPTASGYAESWGHRPALDGLRTVAVYLVVLFHAGIGWASGGFIGVDLFFVLSGFLVTNVLLVELDRQQGIRLARFYARRVRRLLPAAVVMIVATSAMFLLVAPVTERLRMVSDARASLLYVANWHFLGEATDYFAETNEPSPFLHFWSLAIEEQFYFVFPLTLAGLAALARRGRRWIVPAGLATLLAVSLGLQLVWSGRDASHAYYGTEARLYQLLAGALLAATAMWWRDRRPALGRWGGVAAAAALGALVLAATSAFDVSPSTRGIVAALCSVVVLAGLEVRRSGPLTALLTRPAMTYLGQISYGTYLWHWPVILVLERLFTLSPITTALLAGALSTALAALSAQLIEQPIRRAPRLDRIPRFVVACGLSLTILAAIVVVPPMLRSDRVPAIASGDTIPSAAEGVEDLEDLDAPVPSGIDWEKVATDYGRAVDCSRDDIEKCIVVPGDGISVMLIGDSHVDMYSPMFEKLARENGMELSISSANGCGWQEGMTAKDPSGCADRQDGRYDAIVPGIDPDVVVLISRGFGPERRREDRDVAVDPAQADLSMEQLVAETSTDTVDHLVDEGRRVVILEPVPNPPDGRNMVDCLSGARRIGECAFTVTGDEQYEPIYRYLALRSDDVVSVDLDRLVCPDLPLCAPIVDGEPVRKDDNHITATFLRNRANRVWSSITETGIVEGPSAG